MSDAVLVTPFDNYSYNVRIKYLEKYLVEIGYNVTVISSDFNHRTKKQYVNNRQGLELIAVPRYKRNFSISRMWSHICFAKRSLERVNTLKPDILYVSGPPNTLFKIFSNYSKNNKCRVIFELGDMWPETMPIPSKLKKLLYIPLLIWKKIRDNHIYKCDFVIFECDFFENLLKQRTNKLKGKTIYMCKESILKPTVNCINNDCIEIVYTGSINNIIDIDLIVEIIKSISSIKDTIFHIIGDGEQKDQLLKQLNGSNAKIIYHGIIYDEKNKQEIYNKCSFALNIMKQSVCVGLTMKSIDYLAGGVPLINNIKYDTMKLIDKSKCGYNIDQQNIKDIIYQLTSLSSDEIIKMKKIHMNYIKTNLAYNVLIILWMKFLIK